MQKVWDKYLDPHDYEVYLISESDKKSFLGNRPALIIIDALYGFTGDSPDQPEEESKKKYPFSAGPNCWKSVEYIRKILSASREVNIPVFYTAMKGSRTVSNLNVGIKGEVWDHPQLLEGEKGTQIVEDLLPVPGEVVIYKKKPSAFFGTSLISELIQRNIDTVIITGCATSCCVRASVVDAFSYNFKVVVPEECVFDRGKATHALSLFDIQQKFAEVLPVHEVINQLNKIIENNMVKE